MPIQSKCQHCDRGISAPEKYAGRIVKCPGCDGWVEMPAVSDAPWVASLTPSDAPPPIPPIHLPKSLANNLNKKTRLLIFSCFLGCLVAIVYLSISVASLRSDAESIRERLTGMQFANQSQKVAAAASPRKVDSDRAGLTENPRGEAKVKLNATDDFARAGTSREQEQWLLNYKGSNETILRGQAILKREADERFEIRVKLGRLSAVDSEQAIKDQKFLISGKGTRMERIAVARRQEKKGFPSALSRTELGESSIFITNEEYSLFD